LKNLDNNSIKKEKKSKQKFLKRKSLKETKVKKLQIIHSEKKSPQPKSAPKNKRGASKTAKIELGFSSTK